MLPGVYKFRTQTDSVSALKRFPSAATPLTGRKMRKDLDIMPNSRIAPTTLRALLAASLVL